MDDLGCLLDNNNISSIDNTSLTNGRTRDLNRDAVRSFVNHMELVGIPLIVVVGLTGNFLSAFIFLQPKLRKMSCSIYLAARAMSDSGFLICIFILWLQQMRVPLIHTQGVCQIDIFMSYLCGFLSVWFIVWVTVENYYRICQPFKVSSFCTVKKAMLMILVTSLIGCVVYSFSTWTNGIVTMHNKQICSMIEKYKLINTVLTYCDCVITFVIPSIIIILITGRIIYTIVKTYGRGSGDKRKGSGQLQTKVSRMLFWVTFIFLVLNLPSHVMRLRALIEIFSKKTAETSPTLYLIQHVLQMIYYLSFAVNFFIYVSLGPAFRTTFLTLFCRPCLPKSNKRNSAMELQSDNTAEKLLSENGGGQ